MISKNVPVDDLYRDLILVILDKNELVRFALERFSNKIVDIGFIGVRVDNDEEKSDAKDLYCDHNYNNIKTRSFLIYQFEIILMQFLFSWG